MALVKYQYQSPFSMINDIRNEMNRLFDGGYLNTNSESEQAFSNWRPQVDIQELADKYLVHADVPGVDPQQIKISLQDNVLTIQGERKLEKNADTNAKEQRFERFYGTFCRQFSLPNNVDGSKIEAVSKHGVLELTVPKKAAASTQYIEVKSDKAS